MCDLKIDEYISKFSLKRIILSFAGEPIFSPLIWPIYVKQFAQKHNSSLYRGKIVPQI